MKEEFHLVPLDCPTCGAAVEAEGEDVVFYCVACRNGFRFVIESRSLERIDVGFVAAPGIAAHRYAPFWVLDAEVSIEERRTTTSGGPVEWLSRLFSGSEGLSEKGGRGRAFIVPAFHASLSATLELTRRYTSSFPDLGERLGEKLIGGCYGVEDARKLAHFAVIAAEVERRDTLQQLRYRIEFGGARLLGAPLVLDGQVWKDGLFGIVI